MNTHQLKVVIVLIFLSKVLFSQSIHEEQTNYYNSLGILTDQQYDKLNQYSNTQTTLNR